MDRSRAATSVPPPADAYHRAVTTLRFLRDHLPNVHGFFYHFVEVRTGRRMWNCEVSSIDTALLMVGVLTVREHFRGTEAAALAREIYERVDWPWMLAGGDTLSMGWGVTASDSAHGYVAWGGPPGDASQEGAAKLIDGTVVPCAAAGSLPFAPGVCLDTLRFMHDWYRDRVWARYGFVDAFNPTTGWTDTDVIGIDVGITLLIIENNCTGWVRRCFMQNPEIGRAMRLAGFRRTLDALRPRG